MTRGAYTVEIDHLPEITVEAETPRDAARAVASLVEDREELRSLADDEPVQIKRPDRRAWGRNLTLGDFRHGKVAVEGSDDEGPIRALSIAAHHGPSSSIEG